MRHMHKKFPFNTVSANASITPKFSTYCMSETTLLTWSEPKQQNWDKIWNYLTRIKTKIGIQFFFFFFFFFLNHACVENTQHSQMCPECYLKAAVEWKCPEFHPKKNCTSAVWSSLPQGGVTWTLKYTTLGQSRVHFISFLWLPQDLTKSGTNWVLKGWYRFEIWHNFSEKGP